MTVVQAVTKDELRKVIFGNESATIGAGAAGLAAGGSSNTGARVWYDKTGSFSVEAVLLEANEKEVVLRRTDGKVVRVPRANLSEADQRYLRQ